jgi:hypothetical protein
VKSLVSGLPPGCLNLAREGRCRRSREGSPGQRNAGLAWLALLPGHLRQDRSGPQARDRVAPAGKFWCVSTTTWDPALAGVLRLPSGRLIRGRGLRHPVPGGPCPDFGLYLLGRQPQPFPWEARWVRWPDFWLPSNPAAAAGALREAWERAATGRVEVACAGGLGRTGTALACLAVLDGLPGEQAVAYVRRHYAPRAVETAWQRRFVTRFG